MQPGFLLINGERNNETRRIFTDGRPHPRDWKPNFYGHSSGHWEGGKVLVADTVGTLPQLQLFYGFVGAGDTEVTERFSLPQADTIHIDTAIKDSAFTKPYT